MSEKIDRKELTALCKRVKEERKDLLGPATALMKGHLKTRRAVRKALGAEPTTVPALAEATGLSTEETLWHITAMRKYGEVVEAEADDSYPRYRLIEKEEGQS